MKEIIIKFEPFVFKQTVFIKNLETGQVTQDFVPQKDLAKYIASQDNVTKVHFFGNKKYADKVKIECLNKFKNQPVEIVINK